MDYSLSAKAIFNQAKRLGMIVDTPEAGDLIVFWRGDKNSWQGHIGIVEVVEGNKLTTIEGNVGKFPSKVQRVYYDFNTCPKLLGFIRVN